MKELTASYQNDKLEFIKNPVVAEFLGFSQDTNFTESDLEKSILSNLQKFLMELGKGYAFVARQQHIHTEKQDYYIDLVFYNYILKCFVLIDLKTEKITHFFILRASGQSMIEAGIDDGDLVVVRKQVEANEGDIVVALVDNQNTLKRYYRDNANKKIILHPENKTMKDIIVDDCYIQGVACHIIKKI